MASLSHSWEWGRNLRVPGGSPAFPVSLLGNYLSKHTGSGKEESVMQNEPQHKSPLYHTLCLHSPRSHSECWPHLPVTLDTDPK